MANPINLRFNNVLGLLCTVTLLMQKSGAADFAIGGSKGWSVPSDAASYNQWAERNRFQIGDSIVFNYSPGQDSVLLVSQDDYTNCNTNTSTDKKFTDGHTAFKFDKSGPFYFISGNRDNCLKNEKVAVIVLADRSNRNATAPSPAPSGEESPPSPGPGTAEINPTPSPETYPPPPPNGASSIFMSFMGSIGAFAASSSLLLL